MLRRYVWLMMALCLLQTAVWAAGAPLRLAVGMAKPPYVEGNGSRGLEVDIVLAALREAGISVQVQQMPQARGLQSVLNGNVDAMISLVPNAAPSLYFSRPIVQYRNRAITLASSHITLNYLSDLSHYRVASFQNATYLLGYGFSKAVESAPFYAEYADQETLNRLLFNKRADVVVGDEWVFHSYATQASQSGMKAELRTFELFDNEPRRVGFVSRSQRDAFDHALLLLQKRGEIERIHRYYQQKYRLQP